ncbi:transporter [Flavivirga aquatica]|uniref:Transporter n=1 Tax=Flavivirga aquatica TaxID=1849968 RepID=A0A1E5TBL3_9FLAO|nr:outer membrane protein transport protein [Flavivirga aquatica]OEK08748.1 transporter [Flavivirga aquatica]
MKKLNLLFIGLLSMSTIYAQDISDALRFSQDEIQGTARFRALSGAFGALGGDMSAISLNPAGSAVFIRSHASFSLSNRDIENNTQYFNGFGNSNDSNFNINQGGAAFVFANNNLESPWKKFTLAVNYDRTNSHDDDWFAVGTNTRSLSRYFLEITEEYEAPFGTLKLRQGEFLEEAYSDIGTIQNNGFLLQQVFLGYWGGIIDPVNLDDNTNDDNLDYTSNLRGNSFNQDYTYASNGYNGKVSFNAAAQYENNLYIGVNLNSHFIDYQRSTLLLENNSNSNSIVTDLEFGNTLSTVGRGFSFQLGSIFKITPELRAGLTYDSPTWYVIEEETTQSINSNNADTDIAFISDIINIYPEYKLQTPGKITGSLAYVFGKQGLLSFDYSRKNYGSIKFNPESDFTDLNRDIDGILTTASTYKVGGEYKHKQFSFRGGYRFEESPYVNGITVGDLKGYSLGIGYNFGNTKLDLTYDQSERSFATPLYNIGLIDTVSIDRTNSNVTLSISFNI